jgi:iron complex outermembrane recepter protein
VDLAPPQATQTVVVTATRVARDPMDIPASLDTVGAERIRSGQLQVNLSETLPALPGVVANNRQNYAQDLQVSIRGFGARSTFGVRGVRVIVDGIPATLPDGQAQISHIDLGSAERIEVLRGPFSVLYGNSSGGVINVVTQSARPGGEAAASVVFGSDAIRRVGALASGTAAGLGYTVSAGHFETDGYREHSHAVRRNANAKLRYQADDRTAFTFIANALDMPDTQDPLGLTREQFERDPRSVAAVALLFDTRKSVDQAQAGVVVDHTIDGTSALRFAVHGGVRGTQQFQSIPAAVQAGTLHPGGVIDLARRYSGVDARYSWDASAVGTPLSFVVGVSADRLVEDRRGFQNFVGDRLGVQGELRRDEINRVTESGLYAQVEWAPAASWRVLAGVRESRVAFRSQDRFFTPANPDDSGYLDFRATTPVAGVLWRASDCTSLYASAGRGFETPTTNELAYRRGNAPGLNFELEAARSEHYEAGIKWAAPSDWRSSAALFRIDTDDEIVVDTNVGGRSTFRNAGKTRRDGVELQVARDWRGVGVTAAFTSLRARYLDGFDGAAGNRIPGIPRATAYAEVRWRPREAVEVALEARHSASIPVNDSNTDAAPAYTAANVRLATRWRFGSVVARPFLRVDNLFDKRYAGSVIVNEGNSRFFEPAPGRTWLAGVSLSGAF